MQGARPGVRPPARATRRARTSGGRARRVGARRYRATVSSTTARTGTRNRPGYTCTECGWTTAKWVGRCGECQAWGTVLEDAAPTGPRTSATSPGARVARPIGEIDVETARARPTGVGELDRVLGGGLVPGAVVLMAGEPGRRQVDAAAGRRGTAGQGPRRPRAVPDRRGVGRSGTAARGTDRRGGARAAARRRDRSRHGTRPDRGDRPDGAGARLRADHRLERRRGLTRGRVAGP